MGKNKKKSSKSVSSSNKKQTKSTSQNVQINIKKTINEQPSSSKVQEELNDSVSSESVNDIWQQVTKKTKNNSRNTNQNNGNSKQVKENVDHKKSEKRCDDLNEPSKDVETNRTNEDNSVANDWEDANVDKVTKLQDDDNELETNYAKTKLKRYIDKTQQDNNYSKSTFNNFKKTQYREHQNKNEPEELDNYHKFEQLYINRKLKNVKQLKEEHGDLFQYSNEYALAHCVAEDMHMNAGIAITFRKVFKRVGRLLDQRQPTGGCAYLNVNGRYIYYLVTKKYSSGKPIEESLFNSLCKMKSLLKQHKVSKLAMPTIGCGLDDLIWERVEAMVMYIFRGVDTEITICHYKPKESDTSQVRGAKKAHIVDVNYSLMYIESETIILYFGSEDSTVTPMMKELDKKFNILKDYEARKTIGDAIKTTCREYDIYGCIVRKLTKDKFGFESFEICLKNIRKNESPYFYIAFEKSESKTFDDKLLNLVKFIFYDLHIYTCAPIEGAGICKYFQKY